MEPGYEPENKTICSETGDKHDWEWDNVFEDWLCLQCNVWHDGQEEEQ